MEARDLIRLVDALGDVRERARVAGTLAQSFEAEAVFAFVPDPKRGSKMLPAPGFPKVPSMRGWIDLLARCVKPGIELGTVCFPDGTADRSACAYVFEGIAFVLVGPTGPSRHVHESLAMVSRILGTMLRSEMALAVAEGELEIERQSSQRAEALTNALDRARAAAERATRVKDEFLAMLGHELRNPLAPIVTGLQLLRIEGIETRTQDVLERQVAHMLRLVDDLLDVSRITSGKIELRKEPTELGAAVTRAIEMSRPLLEQRRAQLIVEVPERGLVIDGDPARLAQIVANLVTNAAKYADLGSSIEVRAKRDDLSDTARLTVTDHGIGIDATYLDQVFDQFVQVPQGLDRSAGGLGLGLAIVRSLVERHGGSVHAESKGVGRGSTFIVELPLATSTLLAQQQTPAATRDVRQTTTPARVLVVDDNVDAAVLLAEILVAHGHQAHLAHSGPDALANLGTFLPDAALLDIGLPVMDGYELAMLLRARFPGVKLVALTGYGQASDRERARVAGFDAHLVKPVSIALVTDTLETLLSRPV